MRQEDKVPAENSFLISEGERDVSADVPVKMIPGHLQPSCVIDHQQ